MCVHSASGSRSTFWEARTRNSETHKLPKQSEKFPSNQTSPFLVSMFHVAASTVFSKTAFSARTSVFRSLERVSNTSPAESFSVLMMDVCCKDKVNHWKFAFYRGNSHSCMMARRKMQILAQSSNFLLPQIYRTASDLLTSCLNKQFIHGVPKGCCNAGTSFATGRREPPRRPQRFAGFTHSSMKSYFQKRQCLFVPQKNISIKKTV